MRDKAASWPRVAIPCFLALTVLFDIAPEAIMIHAGRVDLARNLVIYAEMWTPGAAAIVTCLLLGKRLASLRLAWPRARYAWIGYGLPLLAACVTYPVLWLSGLAPSNFVLFEVGARKDLALGGGASMVMFLLVATIGVIRSCSSALGEEIGWRGLLVMLALPGGPTSLGLLLFFLSVTAGAGIAAWLRLRSGSVWRPCCSTPVTTCSYKPSSIP